MMTTRPAAAAAILIFSAVLAAGQDASQAAGSRAAEVTARPPDSLKVAAVQLRSSRDLDDNVARIREHIRRLGGRGVRVAVFPE